MASHPEGRAAVSSLRHGLRCDPGPESSVEDVLLAVGVEVGYVNITSASRMNKAVVVFVKEERYVNKLVESGLLVRERYVPISPLASPTVKVTVSNIPPFIPNSDIERELLRFGTFASGIKMIPLGCKNPALKHVLSFRRQVFMFLESRDQTLDVSFRCTHEGKFYMVYASTGSLKCFECGDIGHKRFACPHKQQEGERPSPSTTEAGAGLAEPRSESRLADTVGSADPQESQQSSAQVEKTEDPNNVAIAQSVEEAPTVEQNVVTVIEEQGTEVVIGEASAEPGTAEMAQEVSEELEVENEDEEGLGEDEMVSDISDVSDLDSQGGDEMPYSLQQINDFLDETFGKRVDVKKFFPDVDGFIASVLKLQKTVSLDALDLKKRYRLKNMISKIRKVKGKLPVKTRGKGKRIIIKC